MNSLPIFYSNLWKLNGDKIMKSLFIHPNI